MGIQSSASASIGVLSSGGPGSAGWWQTALPGTVDQAAPDARPDLTFHENDRTCEPTRFWIEPRSSRFLRSRTTGPAPTVVEASLRLTGGGSGTAARLTGSIKNVSPFPLRDVRLRTQFGVITPPLPAGGVLGPDQTLQFDLPAKGESFTPGNLEDRLQSYGIHGGRSYGGAVREQDLWALAPDLDGRRSLRIDRMLAGQGDVACIYAEFVGAPAPVRLSDSRSPAADFHQWVRAVVPLTR